jgi:hypothetical protein
VYASKHGREANSVPALSQLQGGSFIAEETITPWRFRLARNWWAACNLYNWHPLYLLGLLLMIISMFAKENDKKTCKSCGFNFISEANPNAKS